MISQANHCVRLQPDDMVMPVPVSMETIVLAANCCEQILELLLGDSGDVRGLGPVIAFQRSPQLLEALDRLPAD